MRCEDTSYTPAAWPPQRYRDIGELIDVNKEVMLDTNVRRKTEIGSHTREGANPVLLADESSGSNRPAMNTDVLVGRERNIDTRALEEYDPSDTPEEKPRHTKVSHFAQRSSRR